MNTNQKLLTLALSFLAIGFLTSCSTKKTEQTAAPLSALNITSQSAMASCNRLDNSNFSFDVAAVTDSSGQVNANWLKVKFRYLSADVTQQGYTLRFFKWRMNGSSPQLDSNPLGVASYNLSTGQTLTNSSTGLFANQVTSQKGYYVQLNDDSQYPYQALKLVAYKSDGTVLAQADVLIPEFAANPNDYKLTPDGNPRPSNLQQMHPLNGRDVSQWTQAQFLQHFDQYCF